MTFDPYSLDQDRIHRLRAAAEASWGEYSRPPQYGGHPDISAGQGYVTSRWLKEMLGGHVAQKHGYHFWLSPDKKYALDLVGDRHRHTPQDWSKYKGLPMDSEDHEGLDASHLAQHRPGPPVYKKTNHPIFKDFTLSHQSLAPSQVRSFSARAHKAYES